MPVRENVYCLLLSLLEVPLYLCPPASLRATFLLVGYTVTLQTALPCAAHSSGLRPTLFPSVDHSRYGLGSKRPPDSTTELSLPNSTPPKQDARTRSFPSLLRPSVYFFSPRLLAHHALAFPIHQLVPIHARKPSKVGHSTTAT